MGCITGTGITSESPPGSFEGQIDKDGIHSTRTTETARMSTSFEKQEGKINDSQSPVSMLTIGLCRVHNVAVLLQVLLHASDLIARLCVLFPVQRSPEVGLYEQRCIASNDHSYFLSASPKYFGLRSSRQPVAKRNPWLIFRDRFPGLLDSTVVLGYNTVDSKRITMPELLSEHVNTFTGLLARRKRFCTPPLFSYSIRVGMAQHGVLCHGELLE